MQNVSKSGMNNFINPSKAQSSLVLHGMNNNVGQIKGIIHAN